MHSWFRIQKWILENRKDSRSSKLVLLIQTVWCHTYQMLSVILYICLLYWHECAKSIFIGNHNLKFFTILVSHIEFFILLTKNMLVFSLFFWIVMNCENSYAKYAAETTLFILVFNSKFEPNIDTDWISNTMLSNTRMFVIDIFSVHFLFNGVSRL